MRHTAALLGWLLLCGCQSAGSGQARREYQQTIDSGTNACRTNPAYCAAMPARVRATAQAGASVAGALKAMDAAAHARMREIMKECANQADWDVNLRTFDGKTPTEQQCLEQVGTDSKGKPITRAMQLGQEKHTAAFQCVKTRLSIERPGGFSLEQRYRYTRETDALELITASEEQALLRSGRTSRLFGTLVPDVVIHSGDPLRAEAVYDFKFPCPIGGKANWSQYPEGHPFANLRQGDVYEMALKTDVFRVVPILGVF